MRVLVTGSAGFIGYHLARHLLAAGHVVAGVDNLSAYYDVTLKQRRHAMLAELTTGGQTPAAFIAHHTDITDRPALAAAMEAAKPDIVVHLAAQPGVRYSLSHPETYVQTNIVGSFNVLEECRRLGVGHLLMASTSSAYGANPKMPFEERDPAEWPLTIYAASKRAAEMMAHSAAHLHGLPVTTFRFFTVYGPWGRPDMAPYLFTDAILAGRPIKIFNHGDMERDFTYVGDLVAAITALMAHPPQAGVAVDAADTISPAAPYRLVNIGTGSPVKLMDFIAAIEHAAGREAIRTYLEMQTGDMQRTWADTRLLRALIGPMQATSLESGVGAFVDWFREYYGR